MRFLKNAVSERLCTDSSYFNLSKIHYHSEIGLVYVDPQQRFNVKMAPASIGLDHTTMTMFEFGKFML